MKKGVLAGFVAFLIFMACCTVIAKGIYRAGLVRVQLCHPEKRNITHEVSAVGVIVPGQEFGVYTAENVRVHTILAKAGEKVRAGEALFILDTKDLEEQIKAVQAECDHLQAQINDLDKAGKELEEKQQIAAARLLADYDCIVWEQDLLIHESELAEDSAKLKWKNAREQADVAAIRMSEDEAYGDSEVDLLAEGLLGKADISTEIALEISLLKKEYERAGDAVERAKLQKEEALREWNRSLEDAQRKVFTETAQKVKIQGELALAKARLERLKDLEQKQGEVCADEDGMILGILVEIGGRTTDRACVLYTALDGSGEIEVPLEGDTAALLSIGDSVDLEYKTALGEKKKETGVISYMEQRESRKYLRIRAEASSLLPGQTVHMASSSRSDIYGTVLPLSAIYEDERGSFVYVVEPVEGILGKEDRVRKLSVTVLEKNGEYAAVRGAGLMLESDIVLSSSGELEAEAAVRVIEHE